uniref:inactive carboxypeptidase-like protein X2 n=1 Tax=Myxine glutinosa TaxID=7769 RepID=UPI003590113E
MYILRLLAHTLAPMLLFLVGVLSMHFPVEGNTMSALSDWENEMKQEIENLKERERTWLQEWENIVVTASYGRTMGQKEVKDGRADLSLVAQESVERSETRATNARVNVSDDIYKRDNLSTFRQPINQPNVTVERAREVEHMKSDIGNDPLKGKDENPKGYQKRPSLSKSERILHALRKASSKKKNIISGKKSRRQKHECPPLGLESMRVKDTQFIASSSKRIGLAPYRGRLNIQSGLNDGDDFDGAWCSLFYDIYQWIQLDALQLTKFTGVITQGRNSIWSSHWVTKYRVYFSNDTLSWKTYQEGGYDVYFSGNKDQETPVQNTFTNPVVARFIRINPQNWYHNGSLCLRMEVLGCPLKEYSSPAARKEIRSADQLDFKHHNYKEMRKFMQVIRDECPDIARIYSIGKSYQGRKLYVMEMSDNPGVHEPGEPEFRYVAGMHGNEVLGKELLLNLMQFLCHHYYAGDTHVGFLINHTRIHLLPSMNPDGSEAAYIKGSELSGWALGRWNQQGIDLNHNFADLNSLLWKAEEENKVPHDFPNHYIPVPGWYNTDKALVAPETRAVIAWMEKFPFVLGASLHGGELVVTYPYDMARDWAPSALTPTPDNNFFKWLATAYASSHRNMADPHRRMCHYDDFSPGRGTVNGAAWHTVPGSMNDFSYLHTNCFEVTIEQSCDKFPPASELEEEWENNKQPLLTFIEQVHRGLTGIVQDEHDNVIANAVIVVDGHNHDVRTAADGDYWRLLNPGEYIVTAMATGFHIHTRVCYVGFMVGANQCDFVLSKVQNLTSLVTLHGDTKNIAASFERKTSYTISMLEQSVLNNNCSNTQITLM